MYRLLPILMMLAVSPDSEKKLENLSSFLTAAKDSVMTIRNGLETFQANMAPLMMNLADNKSNAASQSQTAEDNVAHPPE
ncbi:hypothetical protein Psch_02017 [Pelotomaculum schinkii]|uniref:Uncharacterized protein n=1 Tax=Pelotomaculum schinkii TaxID=78350 RepID=A0A4Y7RHI7_9FIRM|nr:MULTISPECIES: hypothetical protein [Pelotomaculum]TEB08454.1 hypothetical protein Psch_02017 [Pelotomaculum schinkii]TEB17173.1 hypothetical protein Psfp_00677 [Pelotomaculum sp. FP]